MELYTQDEVTKSTKRGKNSIYWTDIVNSLTGRRLSSTAGRVDYNYNENSITFQNNGTVGNLNDMVAWNLQYNHELLQEAYDDGVLQLVPQVRPHMHWEQTTAKDYQFTLRYRVQYNGQQKTTAWTTLTLSAVNDSVFIYSSGTANQISSFKNGSNENVVELTAGEALSATIQFQLWRTDSESEDVDVTFVDCHAPNDRGGSEDEYSKEL